MNSNKAFSETTCDCKSLKLSSSNFKHDPNW